MQKGGSVATTRATMETMAGETSEKSSARHRDLSSRFRQKLRQRSASFSSACSYSTISTKPTNQAGVPATMPTDDVSKQSYPTAAASQATGVSSKHSTSSSRRQNIVSRIKRSRSSDSRRQSPMPSPSPSPVPSVSERNAPRMRSFSSSSRPPSHSASPSNSKYAVAGLVSRHSAGMPRVSTPTSRASPNYIVEERRRQQQMQRRQQIPRSLPGSGRVDSSVSRHGSVTGGRATFHVRLSIGYMTGLKMDRIAKWARQPNNNRIVVGFVELASSGKYTALSQPLLSNVGNTTKSCITKVVWAAPRSGKDTSKARRRLHFALQLERDAAAESRDEEDSFTSIGSYSPEVVKLLIGLKCGDEKLNLGTAKLVINGRETVEQKMDLTMQPVTGPTTGLKTKRSLFGKKQQKNSFTNGDHNFKLTPNATLRVKADIRTGTPGQDGASVWGKDDSSYTTNWTYDTSSAYPATESNAEMDGMMHPVTADAMAAGFVSQTNAKPTFLEQKMAAMGLTHGKDESLFGESPTEMQYNPSATQERRPMHSVPPIPVVSLRRPEDKSYMSALTGPDAGCEVPWWTMACMPTLCGAEADELPKKELKGCTGLIDARSFSFESLDDLGNSSSSSSSSDSSATRMDDLKGTLIQIQNEEPIPPKKPQRRPSRPRPIKPKPKQEDDDNVETLDVTVETYNDLKEAQETLMRYANKVGVNMEELLDEMEQSQKKDKSQTRSRRSSNR